MHRDDLVYVGHAAVAKLKVVSIENFMQWVVGRKAFVDSL